MLFLKYLWLETIFRLFISLMVISPIWLWYVISWGMVPWILVPICFILGMIVAFFVQLLAVCTCVKIYEITWKEGYRQWKQTQELAPSPNQEELKKIKQILNRYKIEVQIKNNNPTAAKIYEEYQCILALTDGVVVAEDIKLSTNRYLNCLKDYDDL